MTDNGGNQAPAAPPGRLYRGWLVTGACFVMAYFAWGVVFYGHGFYIVAASSAGCPGSGRLG